MTLVRLLYIFLAAGVFAALEVQIEGAHGWARDLPTWRIKTPLNRLIKWPYIDGYHVYLWLLLLLLFHLPYFFGISYNAKTEMDIIEAFLVFVLVEDFLWFVINPHWGIKKYFTHDIPWHGKRIIGIPQNILLSIFVFVIFEGFRHLLF